MDIKNITARIKKIKIKKIKISVKILFSNLAGVAAMLLVTNVVIAYSKGEFELPLYDRNADAGYTITLPESTRAPSTEPPEETSADTPNLGMIINPDELIESEEPAPPESDRPADAPEPETAPAFGLYSEELRRQGFAVSDGVYEAYDEAAVNAKITAYQNDAGRILEEGTAAVPPPPALYEYRLVKIAPGYATPQIRHISTNYTTKLAVEPLMDFIIIRNDETEMLCAADGAPITRDFGALGIDILKMRDNQNRAVFKSKSEDAYYIYDPAEGAMGAFVPINFNPLFGDRGVPFMYPSYYGAPGANNRDRARGETGRRLWGYVESDTRRQTLQHVYGRTFNYSENIGVAYQDSPGRGNKLFFFNESGQDLLRGDYFAPDEEEVKIGHLGFFYFDKGMTRAYSRVVDRRTLEVAEREVLLQYRTDSRGYAYFSEFYVPEDYNIKAYSNGMILLEKNGYSGFMNYLGEWVVQPIYKYAQPFFEGFAVIGIDNGKRALIDTGGNPITRFKYDYISNCTGGVTALFEKNEGWTILNKIRRTIEIE